MDWTEFGTAVGTQLAPIIATLLLAIISALATVAVSDGLVYAPDLEGRLHCLDAHTGTVQWVHDTRGEIWGHPLVADGKVYLNTTRDFWILRAGRTLEVLSRSPGGSECPPIAANGAVYAFMRRKLWALARP